MKLPPSQLGEEKEVRGGGGEEGKGGGEGGRGKGRRGQRGKGETGDILDQGLSVS